EKKQEGESASYIINLARVLAISPLVSEWLPLFGPRLLFLCHLTAFVAGSSKLDCVVAILLRCNPSGPIRHVIYTLDDIVKLSKHSINCACLAKIGAPAFWHICCTNKWWEHSRWQVPENPVPPLKWLYGYFSS